MVGLVPTMTPSSTQRTAQDLDARHRVEKDGIPKSKQNGAPLLEAPRSVFDRRGLAGTDRRLKPDLGSFDQLFR
jgi:hypothetical protein